MPDILQRYFNLRREEIPSVLLAALFFFCVLTALMVLRPAREALGLRSGIETVRWLFMGTALITLLVNPVFGLLVSRFRRFHFIAATYLFFAASLLVFYLIMVGAPQAVGRISGQIFYVWFSVFNLFVTMVFWALMADRFRLEQGKRVFGMIAVGGTCGAIFGPWLASRLAEPLGTPALLLIAVGFLVLALGFAAAIVRLRPARWEEASAEERDPDEIAIIGGSAWAGFRAVMQSRYLMGIAVFIVTLAIMATFIYFTRLEMVEALRESTDARTTLFAKIDLITQLSTLFLQALVTGHLMRRLGVPITLALLPLTAVLGFLGLAIAGTLAALVFLEASFKAVQRAITRPARETLYTVISREDKYKSKAFIDTFVYRGGDVVGAQVEGLLGRLIAGLAGVVSVAVPLALIWGALAVWLGRAQKRIAASVSDDQSLRQARRET